MILPAHAQAWVDEVNKTLTDAGFKPTTWEDTCLPFVPQDQLNTDEAKMRIIELRFTVSSNRRIYKEGVIFTPY